MANDRIQEKWCSEPPPPLEKCAVVILWPKIGLVTSKPT
jgi:hypothetical protein